jgi:hypothetical protein
MEYTGLSIIYRRFHEEHANFHAKSAEGFAKNAKNNLFETLYNKPLHPLRESPLYPLREKNIRQQNRF